MPTIILHAVAVEEPTAKALVPQPSGASVPVQGLVDGDAHAGARCLETDGGVQTLTKWRECRPAR